MSNIKSSVTQEECTLSVFYGKRTVNLSRTGEKGEILKNSKKFIGYYSQKTKSNEPTNERGWEKLTKTNVQQIRYVWAISNPKNVSQSSMKELRISKNDLYAMTYGEIHDIAYEIARGHNYRLLGWKIVFNKSRQTIICNGDWHGETFTFKITQG